MARRVFIAIALVLLAVLVAIVTKWSRVKESASDEPQVHTLPSKISAPSDGDVRVTVNPPAVRQESNTSTARLADPDLSGKKKEYRQYVEARFGWAIKGLGLTMPDQDRLLELLVERVASGIDARDVVSELPDPRYGERAASVAEAEAKVDEQILATFGPELSDTVNLMLKSAPYIGSLQKGAHGRNFAAAGIELSPKQLLDASRAFLESYGELGANLELMSRARSNALPPSEFLTNSDLEMLERVRSVLTAPQWSVLRMSLIESNMQLLDRLRVNPSQAGN